MIRLPRFLRRKVVAPEPTPAKPRTFRILYVPALHGVLEYDELTTLTGEGHRVFSLGDHWNRAHPVSNGRDSKPQFFDDEFTALFLADPGCSPTAKTVTPGFCANFDVVIVSGADTWLFANLASCGATPVVYRTIGQSNDGAEAEFARLADRISIVRYSPREEGLPGFAKTDASIYFGKECGDYPMWTGEEGPITFHSHYNLRSAICVPDIPGYTRLTEGFDAALYGLAGEGIANYRGHLSSREQFPTLARAGCYVYVWSKPPSYTLSLMEAMLVGVPVVAPSARLAATLPENAGFAWVPERYEVPALLSGGCGLTYDTIEQGREQIAMLLSDRPYAETISHRARERAQRLFGNASVGPQWTAFFETVVPRG